MTARCSAQQTSRVIINHNCLSNNPRSSTSSRKEQVSSIWVSKESLRITDKRNWSRNWWKTLHPKNLLCSIIRDTSRLWKKKTSLITRFAIEEAHLRRKGCSLKDRPKRSARSIRSRRLCILWTTAQKCLENAKEKLRSSSQFCRMSWEAVISFGLGKRSSKLPRGLAWLRPKSTSGGGIRLANGSNAWKSTIKFLKLPMTKKIVTVLLSLLKNYRNLRPNLLKILMNRYQEPLINAISLKYNRRKI